MARAMSQETWKLRGDLSRPGERNTVAQHRVHAEEVEQVVRFAL
jgi:hypothetical protein